MVLLSSESGIARKKIHLYIHVYNIYCVYYCTVVRSLIDTAVVVYFSSYFIFYFRRIFFFQSCNNTYIHTCRSTYMTYIHVHTTILLYTVYCRFFLETFFTFFFIFQNRPQIFSPRRSCRLKFEYFTDCHESRLKRCGHHVRVFCGKYYFP